MYSQGAIFNILIFNVEAVEADGSLEAEQTDHGS
jgi:hypothetical protein